MAWHRIGLRDDLLRFGWHAAQGLVLALVLRRLRGFALFGKELVERRR
jgi:hypothetical protein